MVWEGQYDSTHNANGSVACGVDWLLTPPPPPRIQSRAMRKHVVGLCS